MYYDLGIGGALGVGEFPLVGIGHIGLSPVFVFICFFFI